MKSAPYYWWDFAHNEELIIVHSDCDEGEILGKFPASQVGVEKAEKLIADFNAGRKVVK